MTTSLERVELLLELAGIEPTPAEVERLALSYPSTREAIERLWALDLGDTPPSLVFRAGEAAGPTETIGPRS